ncbi:hypothetical protein DXV76_20750 [Rhodobacteraceae bacterium CCMM004]|nr:hypothetical protein DXV76_20750 [Rhodobacteraceae bacterium CCMM004]
MTGTAEPSDDDDVLAAEFALRLLDAEAAAAAQRRVLSDRDFADRVAFWNAALAELAEEIDPVTPSAEMRRQVMDRLFAARQAAETAAAGVSRLWRALGIGATVAAVALAAALFWTPVPVPPRLAVVEIVSDDGALRYLAILDGQERIVRLVRTDGGPPADGSLQLWGIAPDAPPVSLGVLPVDARMAVPVPEALAILGDGLTLAVSREPAGGSPTGQPTGEVVASGEAADL